MNLPLFSRQRNRRAPRTRRPARRQRRRGNPQQAPTGAYHLSVPRQTALPMPREFSVALVYYENDTVSAATGILVQTFGLFEMLGNRPLYTDELYNIYRYCRITAVHVQYEVVSTSSVPLRMVVATCPYNDTTTMTTLIEKPRAVYKTLGGSSGFNRGVLRKTFYSQEELGNPVYDKTYWMTDAQASATSPQDGQTPVIRCGLHAMDNVSTWSAEVSYRVTYHLQFFDLDVPAIS